MGIAGEGLRRTCVVSGAFCRRALLLLVGLCVVNQTATAATTPLEITLDAKGIAVGDQLELDIDDLPRSILPARIEPFAVGEKHKLSIVDPKYGYGFFTTISRTDTGWTTSESGKMHCDPIEGTWRVDGSRIVVSLKKTATWTCGSGPATGAPDGRGKIEFSSVPDKATLYYPMVSAPGYLVAPTTVTLVVNYLTNVPVMAIMKADGFYDCAVRLQFSGPANARVVSANGAAPQPINANGTVVAKVRCELKKVN